MPPARRVRSATASLGVEEKVIAPRSPAHRRFAAAAGFLHGVAGGVQSRREDRRRSSMRRREAMAGIRLQAVPARAREARGG
jgi:hypothetical protein